MLLLIWSVVVKDWQPPLEPHDCFVEGGICPLKKQKKTDPNKTKQTKKQGASLRKKCGTLEKE